MLQFLSWYIVITIVGLLTFPFSYRMLPALPDRGYALSRTLGLLLWAFIFWLTVSLGISQNTVGGLLLALLVVVALSVWAIWKVDSVRETVDGGKPKQPATLRQAQGTAFDLQPILKWCKTNGRYIVSVEVVFLLAFAAMAFIRANNPDITGTEKPMEMAFINAIIHSPTFPPHDPWLSGYAISYYYFGYVMVAMLAEITSTVGSIAFNLMLALVFGLGSIGAYGLVYNLLQAYWAANPEKQPEAAKRLRSLVAPVLAPIFLLVLGNWSAFLEVLHKYGVGWTGKPGDVNFWTTLGVGYIPDGAPAPYNFWTWLNILDLKDPPQGTFGGPFDRLGAWWASDGISGLGKWFSEAFLPDRGGWWWRASRVITDYNLRGQWNEIIDEFPAFSYLLGDLHPHVLAAPFGLLIGSLALNLYLGGFKGQTNLFKLNLPNGYVFDLKFPVKLEAFILMSVVLGGLAFLNTWAFPMYLGLISLSLVLMLIQERGWGWDLLEDFLKFTIPLALFSVILYLPFYIGFSSQAGGILPNVIYPTRATHLWVMFGGLFVPMFAFLIYLRGKENANWRTGFLATIGLVVALLLFSTIVGIAAASTTAGQQFISSQGASSTWDVLREAFARRLAFGGSLLTLALLIGGAGSYIVATKAQGSVDLTSTDSTPVALPSRSPIPFVLMVILLGGLLVLAPDFVFLRDQFGDRMNTIFKFYYEAWALWAVAAAFAVVVMLSELRGWTSKVFMALVVILLAIGSLFSLAGFPNKTNNFDAAFVNRDNLTLDGAAYLERYHADEFAALQFLVKAAPGTLVEAVGGSYQDTFDLASTYSGKPTVLGWNYHETQWRGGEKEKGTREDDVKTLYVTHDWAQAQEILTRYDIRYIYVGPRERELYNVYDTKFIQYLSPVFSQGQVVIYVVP